MIDLRTRRFAEDLLQALYAEYRFILMTGGVPMLTPWHLLVGWSEPRRHGAFSPDLKYVRIGEMSDGITTLNVWTDRFYPIRKDSSSGELLEEAIVLAHELGHVKSFLTMSSANLERHDAVYKKPEVLRGIRDNLYVVHEEWTAWRHGFAMLATHGKIIALFALPKFFRSFWTYIRFEPIRSFINYCAIFVFSYAISSAVIAALR